MVETNAQGETTPVYGIDETGLSERQRQVIKLRKEGLSWAAIARTLKVSRARVGQLKAVLEQKGFDLG